MRFEDRSIPLHGGQDRSAREATANQRTDRTAEAHNMELMQTLDDAWNT